MFNTGELFHLAQARRGGPYAKFHLRISNFLTWVGWSKDSKSETIKRSFARDQAAADYLIGVVHDAQALELTDSEIESLFQMLDGDKLTYIESRYNIVPIWDVPGRILSAIQAEEVRRVIELGNNLGVTRLDITIGEGRNRLPIRIWSSPTTFAIREVASDRLGLSKNEESYRNLTDFVSAYQLKD